MRIRTMTNSNRNIVVLR